MKTPVSIGLRLLLLCAFGADLPISAAETNTAASLYLIRQKDKFGFADRNGKIVIEPQFYKARPFKDGMAWIQVDGGRGFIDQTGKIVVQPRFVAAEDFSGGLAAVTLDGEDWGYVDKSGVVVIKPQFPGVLGNFHGPPENPDGRFAEGLAYAQGTNQSGYIDKTGRFVIRGDFRLGQPFSEGLAFAVAEVKQGNKPVLMRGYIDKSGKFVIAGDFDWGGIFSGGVAAVGSKGKTGFIDRNGRWLKLPAYSQGYFPDEVFSEGLLYLAEKQGDDYKFGFVNQSGEMVIPFKFDGARNFSEGLAEAYTGNQRDLSGKWGYINKKGEWVIPPTFTSARAFSGGLAIVEVGGRWERRSIMRKLNDSKWALIDRTGKYVWGPSD